MQAILSEAPGSKVTCVWAYQILERPKIFLRFTFVSKTFIRDIRNFARKIPCYIVYAARRSLLATKSRCPRLRKEVLEPHPLGYATAHSNESGQRTVNQICLLRDHQILHQHYITCVYAEPSFQRRRCVGHDAQYFIQELRRSRKAVCFTPKTWVGSGWFFNILLCSHR